MADHAGNIQPEIDTEEHLHAAMAKRIVARGFDGTNWPTLATNSLGRLQVDVITGGGGGGGGSGTEFAEDSPHTTGDRGVMALGVQKGSEGALGGEGDYEPFQLDVNGNLRIGIAANQAVTAHQGNAIANPWNVALKDQLANAIDSAIADPAAAARGVVVRLPPGDTNIGNVDVASGTITVGGGTLNALPAIATAAAPTYTEGSTRALSVDLAGGLRVILASITVVLCLSIVP